MHDREKEHLLHKIVASSAFLFALSILPVAQYFLVTNQLQTQTQSGVVAGASTDKTITQAADVPQITPGTCIQDINADIASLEAWRLNKEKGLDSDYQKAIEPYTAAKSVLTGDPTSIAQESGALDMLINDEHQKYLDKIGAVEKAINQQKIDDRANVCAASAQ